MLVRLITAILSMHALGALAAEGAAPRSDPWGAVIFLGAVGLFIAWFIWRIMRDSKNRKNP